MKDKKGENKVNKNPSPILRGSIFEQYKAQQRYNRRNGHKTHKKKYKDYLRHTWAITTTNPKLTGITERAIISDNIDIAIDNTQGNARTITKYDKTTIENERNEHRQRQRLQKLRAEKSRGFVVPPIFVIASDVPSTVNRQESLPVVHNLRNNITANVLQDNNNNKMKILDKPFYEGQINYYLETKDGDNDDIDESEIDVNDKNSKIHNKMLDSSESSTSWYNRVGPMLRNGLRTISQNQNMEKDLTTIHHRNQPQQLEKQLHHRNRQHHEHIMKHHHNDKQLKHHDHVHHFSHAFHHRHHQKHHHKLQQQQQQRKKQSFSVDNKNRNHELANYIINTTPEYSKTQTPYPLFNHKRSGMASTIGHQITELEDFKRYYAKWPHLARVQFQVYDEHMQEAHEQKQQQQQQKETVIENEEYPEYEYESLADLEEAQKTSAEDANMPPYIRKYNRRNKQLLNLLEGPLPPPQGYHWSGSKLQPGPLESNSDTSIVRIDDEYMREKRKRYHQLHNNNKIHDLFAQQRTSNKSISEYNLQPTLQSSVNVVQNTTTTTNLNQLTASNNRLPDEDVNLSTEDMKPENWKEEIKLKWNDMKEIIGNVAQINKWRIETPVTHPTPNIITLSSSSTTTQTPKSLVFRLPTFNNKYVDSSSMRQRSRSAHFASSPEQRRHVSGFLDSMELHGHSGEQEFITSNRQNQSQQTYSSTVTPTEAVTIYNPPKIPTLPPRSISAFVYHRVVDDSTPKRVGTGSGVQGRKQQLPFVAITDRRLETFKKSLLERQKEFEQNNFPPLP